MVSSFAIMPGSFTLDSTLPPKLDINVGAKSHFFQPPQTPSVASSLHYTTSLSTQDSSGHSSRKRQRRDTFTLASSHTLSMRCNSPSAPDTYPSAQSPAPFVSTTYELSGGLDTPTAEMLSAMDLWEEGSPGLRGRDARGFLSVDHASDSYFPHQASALAREFNGRSRIPPSPRIRDGFGRAVGSVVGVAGKVLEFCRTTAFRGFFAGGGQGYPMDLMARPIGGAQGVWVAAECEKTFNSFGQENTLVPGRFPEENYIADYTSQTHTTPPRAYKKRQREKVKGGLSTDWVMVDSTTSRESSPSRLSHRKVPLTATSARRPVQRSGRRPILPASRPSLRSYAHDTATPSDKSASYASPRSQTSAKYTSPISLEVQRRAAKMRQRELEEDAHLKRFNQQLKAMIKEGKEALGTKFEVEEEPMGNYCVRDVEAELVYDQENG